MKEVVRDKGRSIKVFSSFLTEKERDRLENRDPATSKQNDFIVRRKFKRWLDELLGVSLYVIRYLPEKQLKKLIDYRHIQEMINLLYASLIIWGVVPIVQKDEHAYMSIMPDGTTHETDSIEIVMNGELRLFILNLFALMSASDVREIMQTEINRRHNDYVLVRKKEQK